MDRNPLFAQKTIALHNFVEKKECRQVPKEDYVLYFGRFSTEKGIDTLIQACRKLPEISFVFAGIGPLADEIDKVENIKKMLDFSKVKKLVELIQKARFSVYPSEMV